MNENSFYTVQFGVRAPDSSCRQIRRFLLHEENSLYSLPDLISAVLMSAHTSEKHTASKTEQMKGFLFNIQCVIPAPIYMNNSCFIK